MPRISVSVALLPSFFYSYLCNSALNYTLSVNTNCVDYMAI